MNSVIAYLVFEHCSLDDVGEYIVSYGIDSSTTDIDSHAGEIGDKSEGSWLAISGMPSLICPLLDKRTLYVQHGYDHRFVTVLALPRKNSSRHLGAT